jgi:hypothetical protein
MSPLALTLRREARVAFSLKAQPLWFRILKWTCIVTGVALFHDRAWFWWTFAGLAAAGTCVHLLYRWKTGAWTCAWGGWNDLEAGRPRP